ncbi:hypothetical protein MRS44_015082 [Fusarium solani]|uniref:Uncharacterized protein n=1 Tax=Fusarium solani TaxID=169388 RepID=A0A9P9GIY2_FUSSL|nr:uncharacterized protein B0J15DRAFT_470556 [Fusarium solani]KAH7239573.1 hypothetical protein B0J15DRAFT_470556 [Fusarium solani]KAJ3459009.1 hypothetical protein MRS44_015082 [Fusarium solani]
MQAPSRSPVDPGNNLYIVCLQADADASTVKEFINSAIKKNNAHLWTDFNGRLISWKVEASPSEVVKLKGHVGIATVTKLEVPVQQRDDSRKAAVSKSHKHYICPVDGKNLNQCNVTGASLKVLLNDNIGQPRMWDGVVRDWEATLTIDQAEQIRGMDGIEKVKRVHKGRRGVCSRLPDSVDLSK